MPLSAFWRTYTGVGFHETDATEIPLSATADEWRDGEDQRLHRKLMSQPFYGNLDSAAVYILFGNPGAVKSDYDDLTTEDNAS